jgi:hypothetical protein
VISHWRFGLGALASMGVVLTVCFILAMKYVSPLECHSPVLVSNERPSEELGYIVNLTARPFTIWQAKWLTHRYELGVLGGWYRGSFLAKSADAAAIRRLGCSRMVESIEFVIPAELN